MRPSHCQHYPPPQQQQKKQQYSIIGCRSQRNFIYISLTLLASWHAGLIVILRDPKDGEKIVHEPVTQQTHNPKAASSFPERRFESSLIKKFEKTQDAGATSTVNNRKDRFLSSHINLRRGTGWSHDGVRPGCVYIWCFPHPQAPAPANGYTFRPAEAEALVAATSGRTAMLARRYEAHARRLHRNRTDGYYYERKLHIDLEHVAFRDGQLHVYDPDQNTIALLQSPDLRTPLSPVRTRGGKNGPQSRKKKEIGSPMTETPHLPCYDSIDKALQRKNGMSKGSLVGVGDDGTSDLCPPIIVHDKRMDVEKDCSAPGADGLNLLNRTLFVLAPHFPGNFFHLMNDNLVPLVTDLQATPGCDPQTLRCEERPAALMQFWSDPKRTAGGAQHWWKYLFPPIFGHRSSGGEGKSASMLSFSAESDILRNKESGGSVCVGRLSWGLGPRPFYVDFVQQRQSALSAVRAVALRNVRLDDTSYPPPLRLPSIAAGDERVPRVVFIVRYKKSHAENPRGAMGSSYNRVLADPELLSDAFAARGAPMESCCNFFRGGDNGDSGGQHGGVAAIAEDLASADILVSLHGAGLVNAIFAEDGVVLVELHGSYGADDVIFRRLAQGRKGGYLRARVVETPEAHYIRTPERASAIADCALALWRGELCTTSHNGDGSLGDIEESYRAVDMAVN